MRTIRPNTIAALIAAAVGGVVVGGAVVGCVPTPDNAPAKVVRIDDKSDRDPELAKSLNGKAAPLLEAGDYDGAEKLLDRAIAADADFGPAHNNLGAVYFYQSRRFKALQQFMLASALLPLDPKPRNGIGLSLESSGRFDEAVDYYDRARVLAPDNLEYTGNAARARFRRGDRTDELRAMLEKLAANDPRPQWNQWARETLRRMNRPATTEPGGG